jgi:plastocyanin
MRTAALLSALLLAILASPLAVGSGGHDEGTPEPEEHDEEGVTSPELQPGQSFNFTFTEAMTFDYHCHPHPWMLAAVEVLPSDGSAPRNLTINITEPAGEDFESWTFAPKTFQARVGDTITWVNNGTVMHRVTQTVGEHIAHVGTLGGTGGDSDVHAEDAAAQAAQPGGFWWFVVAGVGGLCVLLWVRGNKAA